MNTDINGSSHWFLVKPRTQDYSFARSISLKATQLLPWVYCPVCKQKTGSKVGADIPEPLAPEIKKLLQPYQHIPADIEQRYLRVFDEDLLDEPENLPIVEAVEQFACVSPAEFSRIEQIVRHAYALPPHRPVLPRARVGTLTIRPGFVPRWEVYHSGSGIFFSQIAAERLAEAGVSGIELLPVCLRDGHPSRVYEAVITGRGGLPLLASAAGEYYQCPECAKWYLRANHPVKTDLDVSQWDGSDFFHLMRGSSVYISARAYRLFRTLFLAPTVWMSFVPMSGYWEHPDFDLAGNPFS